MLFHLATPYMPLAPSMAAAVMRNRVLVPAYAWLYFLNLSRFSVDRRGHFRAVGETTTADLVTYKQKQRAAAEETKAKAVCIPFSFHFCRCFHPVSGQLYTVASAV